MKNSPLENRHVPVLITWDVDPDRWATPADRENALNIAMDLCAANGIRSTFYITANHAHEYPAELARMAELGQEVGCHGLTHTDEEDYNRMPESMQRDYIAKATEKLTAATGLPTRSFRSPRVKTSAATLRVLSELGYLSDSTVCSQRIDFISSNLINPGWIVAPRTPYHPHPDDPYKRGNLPLWEIPVSALVLPFISGTLNVFGLTFMQRMFDAFYREAKRTGKPIVYLAHPPELAEIDRAAAQASPHLLTQKFSLSQIKTHGLLIRRKLYKMDAVTWRQATADLFAYMARFDDVRFVTAYEYAQFLQGSEA